MLITVFIVLGFALIVGAMRVTDWFRTRRPAVVLTLPTSSWTEDSAAYLAGASRFESLVAA
ncbi:MAG: hypothetical protein QM747_02430 [Nocardioides sp.]